MVMEMPYININMGEYVLNSPMMVIPMGGVDVLLGVQWLQSLGTTTFNFSEDFNEIFLGRKIICAKWHHRETKQGDKL